MALIDNLVSYWKLDESSGNAADAHGSNTLTNNGTTPFVAAKINNGADLEAGSSQSFSITDGSQSGLDFSTALSFAMWFKPESQPPAVYFPLVRKSSQPGQEAYTFSYSVSGGANLRISVDATGNGTSTDTLTVSQTLSNATFYHIVVTWDGGTKTAKFYVDGSQVGGDQTGTNVASIFNSSADFVLGADGTFFTDGVMDEVGAWSRVLTSGEASSLYNGGAGLAYPFTSIKTWNGLADASTKTYNGLARASIKTFNGLA